MEGIGSLTHLSKGLQAVERIVWGGHLKRFYSIKGDLTWPWVYKSQPWKLKPSMLEGCILWEEIFKPLAGGYLHFRFPSHPSMDLTWGPQHPSSVLKSMNKKCARRFNPCLHLTSLAWTHFSNPSYTAASRVFAKCDPFKFNQESQTSHRVSSYRMRHKH